MDRQGGSVKPARRFSFSWADEVEREEEKQRQQEEEEVEDENRPSRLGGETREKTTKANPFGAARPREVVLAEKGVDWRARDGDRELDASRRGSATRRRRMQHSKRHAAASLAPTRRHDDSNPASPLKIIVPTVSYGSAWGGKRKYAGRQELQRQVADHGRRIFGQLNIGDRGDISHWTSGDNRSRIGTELIEASNAAAVGAEIRDSKATVSAGTEKNDGCGARQRRRRMSGRKMGSNKAKKQQTLIH
ncbi:hypothetical protein GUJ93_ZPchr0001g32493 [Zizania palustris]|uniref:Uncharacterized protein n=1 Tax=Zizania palustris TaxID=103762 RepID=A0A8J5RVH5_ZIZPA|nr:hypothetical protein GUJ93_ZPchr0001g32493 [Zizania palustris]